MKKRKIAVIGGGGAGSVAAWLLNSNNDVTLFEANDYLGGHAYSHPISTNSGTQYIDMGVEYFNERLSPNLCKVLSHFNIGSYVAPLTMQASFPGQEIFWNNMSGDGALGQELRDELDRFHLDMADVMSSSDERYKSMSIGQYLDEKNYSDLFKYKALVPMMTVYSGCNAPSMEYTLKYVAISFSLNLLSFFSPGYWRKAKGGINGYIAKIREELGERVKLNTPVERVIPTSDGVKVQFCGESKDFDCVIFATHADVTLRLLATDDRQYRDILGNIDYVPVKSYFHHDTRWMSEQDNNCYCQFKMEVHFDSTQPDQQFGSLTRVNNALPQYRKVDRPLLVTFDPKTPVAEEKVSHVIEWKLPKLRPIDFHRKTKIRDIQGKNNLWFCGMDTSLTGHEGAVVSAMVIADRLGAAYRYQDITLAYVQFKVIKDIMGVYHPREKLAASLNEGIFRVAKSLSLHKAQSHKFIKDFMV